MGVVTSLPVIRGERGLTQQGLAELLGVSRQTINSIERGRFEPSLSLALKAALLLQLPVDELFRLDVGHGFLMATASGEPVL
ncbi:helix-turn-helix transcriptional regulator [Sphingomonas sp.]|jgi:putative transcriptional regulator|uniref:helix-turn-helix transcriptional regulator n=1 Tax=Sphingomonas sp. TaxID=28214 RepID=UPI002ED77A3E